MSFLDVLIATVYIFDKSNYIMLRLTGRPKSFWLYGIGVYLIRCYFRCERVSSVIDN